MTSRQSHILAVVSTKIVSVMIKITILDSSFWSNGTSSPGKSRQQELSTPTTFKWTYVACAVKSAWFQGFYHSVMNCSNYFKYYQLLSQVLPGGYGNHEEFSEFREKKSSSYHASVLSLWQMNVDTQEVERN